MLVESHANVQNVYSAAKDARTFCRVHETRWNEVISSASLRTPQESKWNVPLLLPFTKDVQTLHSYLDVQQQLSHSILSTESSPQTWPQQPKITLTQVILFNRQRAGEVSKMSLSAKSIRPLERCECGPHRLGKETLPTFQADRDKRKKGK